MSAHRTAASRLRPLIAGLVVITAAGVLSGCSLVGNLLGGGNDVFSIEVGDCLNDADLSGEVTSVPIVDCAEPHDSEAYHSHQMSAAELPAEDDLFAEADQACYDAFEDFVGVAYEESTLEFSYYYPTPSSWANGDREILCLAFDPDRQVEGTLAGSAR